MGYCDQNLERNCTVWKLAKNHTIQFVSNCKYICCKWQSSLVNSLSSHFFLIFLQLTITYQASKGFCGKATVLQYYLFIIFNLTSKMALACLVWEYRRKSAVMFLSFVVADLKSSISKICTKHELGNIDEAM